MSLVEALLAARLQAIFLDCFYTGYRTRLVGGAAEPLYEPGDDSADALIHFREDYAASALHEVAHWCIAGEARRRRQDYGYWYAPDGRTRSQQRAFEQVEVRPQAVEWHLALAAGVSFSISADNLAAPVDTQEFEKAVVAQARVFCESPLPPRAALYRDALAEKLGGVARPTPGMFVPGRRAA